MPLPQASKEISSRCLLEITERFLSGSPYRPDFYIQIRKDQRRIAILSSNKSLLSKMIRVRRMLLSLNHIGLLAKKDLIA